MAGKKLVTLGYILVFWGALPGTLAALAAWGQRVFGPRLRLPSHSAAAILLTAGAGAMLAVSIVQFTRAAGSLPISAFPPRRLIRTGVFGVWRHPIYLFSVLFYGGLGTVFWPSGSLLVLFPVLALGTTIYARVEENGLEKRFGRSYEGYRRQTSILVPRFIHFARLFASALSRALLRFEVSGRENAAVDPPCFVVSSHRSYLDSVFVSLAMPFPVHFITTSGVFRRPFSRFVFTKLLALPKKRYRPDIRNALDIRRRLLDGCAVGIFPEAERSWTGAMAGFKPETLKLLLGRPDVPIVPVRLEGTYRMWPRWARSPVRAKVTAAVEKPVFAGRGESPRELEARLTGLIGPRPAPDPSPRPRPAGGIESAIYRCPECLSWDTLESGKGPDFRCSACLARFRLFSDFSVRKSGAGAGESLESICGRVRAKPLLPGCGRIYSNGATAELAVEKRGRFEGAGTGRLTLSPRAITFRSGPDVVAVGLDSVRAVVVEGARDLQVYGGRPAGLLQFTLIDQSVLKWQDLVVDAVRRRRGRPPATA